MHGGERAGPQRQGGSTAAERTAASEAFLYKVCSYLLSDKDEKKYWVTT